MNDLNDIATVKYLNKYLNRKLQNMNDDISSAVHSLTY
jgi:hypothetical protein